MPSKIAYTKLANGKNLEISALTGGFAEPAQSLEVILSTGLFAGATIAQAHIWENAFVLIPDMMNDQPFVGKDTEIMLETAEGMICHAKVADVKAFFTAIFKTTPTKPISEYVLETAKKYNRLTVVKDTAGKEKITNESAWMTKSKNTVKAGETSTRKVSASDLLAAAFAGAK